MFRRSLESPSPARRGLALIACLSSLLSACASASLDVGDPLERRVQSINLALETPDGPEADFLRDLIEREIEALGIDTESDQASVIVHGQVTALTPGNRFFR